MALRWGIASTGTISFDFANALTTLSPEDHQITAVAARSLSNAKDFAKKFDIPSYYEGYDKLVKDDNVDIIYIGSIVATHYEIAIMSLEAGKHVLCEKPLSLNEKQSKKIIRTARSKNLFFAEAIWSRYFESYKLLRQRIDNGDLGEIKEIDLEFGFPLANEKRIFLKNGGGSTLDLATYPIQLSLWVFREEPSKVMAFGKLNDQGLDMEMTGEFKFDCGGVTKFKVSCLNGLTNNAVIKGTKGQMTLYDFWCPIKVDDVDGSTKTFDLPEGKFNFNLKNSAGLRFEAEDARQLIKANIMESPTVMHEESLRISRVQDKLRKLLGVHFDADDFDY